MSFEDKPREPEIGFSKIDKHGGRGGLDEERNGLNAASCVPLITAGVCVEIVLISGLFVI